MRKFLFQDFTNRKMKIGIFYPHPLHGSLGSIRRVKEIAKRLKDFFEAEIILYSPYESTTISLDGLIVKPILKLYYLSELAYMLSQKIYYGKFLSKFFLTKILIGLNPGFVEKFIKILRKDQISVLQVEHDFSVPLCVKVGKRLKIPVIADIHNITPEELVSTGIIKKDDETYQELQKILNNFLNELDMVCVVSEYMAEYVKRNFSSVDKNKIVVVSHGASLKSSTCLEEASKKVVFSGTVTCREHVDLLVKSIPYISKSIFNVEFYITRKGNEIKKVKKLAKKLNVKINWFWFSSERKFFEFLSSASIGILTSKNDEARRLGTPIKLFDYMSVGLPIIANDIGGWSKIVEEENVGILAKDNPQNFASAIKMLLENENLRTNMSQNALKAVKEKYDWNKTIKTLIKGL
ncbi:glycosyltransferase [Candidatus Bathyarchaeota archaeon]|nr:MAG: glycosyltransferase [Candidatus Bathyarchaeota archaeon]